MSALLAEDQTEAWRSATELEHDSEHLNSENNTLITEAVSQGNVNGQNGLDLNEIDWDDGTPLGEASHKTRKTSPRVVVDFDPITTAVHGFARSGAKDTQ